MIKLEKIQVMDKQLLAKKGWRLFAAVLCLQLLIVLLTYTLNL